MMPSAREIADGRHARNDHKASTRALSPDNVFVGIRGEEEFGRFCGQPVDDSARPEGDGGVDFTCHLTFTVDVKTARVPKWLFVEEGKVRADIYVLAKYEDEGDKARLIGWEWGKIIERAPVSEFGKGVRNHFIEAGRLRPMQELHCRLFNGRNHE